MSQDLLHKSSDNSSFGFNYSRSSIWSLLLPRSHFPIDPGCFASPKKLFFSFAPQKTTKKKKKINLSVSNKKRMVKTKIELIMISKCKSISRRRRRRRDSTVCMKLSNYLYGLYFFYLKKENVGINILLKKQFSIFLPELITKCA
ncbi:hypothetical protein ACJRO7_023925 [Eucalyptus globulus]|uniref:Uncharacterized protein n=1 Tax=Eucalyptus globulus TaxID=34317 RepID=A0ABD3K4P7_EUCGL